MTTIGDLDDDSSGSEFVPEPDAPEDVEEQHRGKKRKEDAAVVEQLAPDELEAMWADMNGSGAASKVAPLPPPKRAAVALSGAPAPPALDVNKLLAELQSAEKPKMKTETVKFAGVDVEVVVKDRKAPGGKPENVKNIIDQLKGKAKRISTIEKSEIDWEAHKAEDKTVTDELDRHMRSGTYLEKVSFLKRAELREYELEREEKLKRK